MSDDKEKLKLITQITERIEQLEDKQDECSERLKRTVEESEEIANSIQKEVRVLRFVLTAKAEAQK